MYEKREENVFKRYYQDQTQRENEINAMSGATITSTAVTNAVNTALEAAGEIVKEAQ